MPARLVSPVPAAPLPGLQTWGELLADIARRLSQERRTVTAARFERVDEPSFRSASIFDRPLDSMRREVEAVESQALMRETVGHGAQMHLSAAMLWSSTQSADAPRRLWPSVPALERA